MINIIGRRKIFLSISGILVVTSLVAIIIFGLKPGIDFTGGSLWQFALTQDVSSERVQTFFGEQLNAGTVSVQKEIGSNSFIVRLPALTEEQHQEYLGGLAAEFGALNEMRFQAIGPSVGAQLRSKAIYAAIFVLLGISLYVAFAFRKVSYPVKSWKYGIITLVSLFHDVIIPTAVLAVLGKVAGVEIDTNFIVALLVVMGFSVHDTIVVFDRIRESLSTHRQPASFEEVVNESINHTLARSINTSLTLVLVLVAMLLVGASTLRLFVLIMLIGTMVGTYSSIFVASPLLTLWHKFGKSK